MIRSIGQHRRRVRFPGGWDVVAASLIAVGVLAGTAVAAAVQPTDPSGVVTVVAVLAAAGVWCLRRVAPVASGAAVVAIVSAYVVAGQPYGPILLLVAAAGFTVARRRSARVAAWACAAGGVVLAAALWTRLDAADLRATVAILLARPVVFVVVPAMAGALAGARAEAAARERAELLARGAYEERLRVAREVRDIAGHGFAVVAMQAGVALTVFEEDPRQARVSLEAIRTSSEHALRELQVGLDTLHVDAPAASDVPDLVERVRATGLSVELTVTGAPAMLAPQVSATVYRLAQEALTNVVRHAGPASATVVIAHGEEDVVVAVRDDGRRARRRRRAGPDGPAGPRGAGGRPGTRR